LKIHFHELLARLSLHLKSSDTTVLKFVLILSTKLESKLNGQQMEAINLMPLMSKGGGERCDLERSLQRERGQRAVRAPCSKINGQQMEKTFSCLFKKRGDADKRSLKQRERGQREEIAPSAKMNGQQMEEIISCHCLFKKRGGADEKWSKSSKCALLQD